MLMTTLHRGLKPNMAFRHETYFYDQLHQRLMGSLKTIHISLPWQILINFKIGMAFLISRITLPLVTCLLPGISITTFPLHQSKCPRIYANLNSYQTSCSFHVSCHHCVGLVGTTPSRLQITPYPPSLSFSSHPPYWITRNKLAH